MKDKKGELDQQEEIGRHKPVKSPEEEARDKEVWKASLQRDNPKNLATEEERDPTIDWTKKGLIEAGLPGENTAKMLTELGVK